MVLEEIKEFYWKIFAASTVIYLVKGNFIEGHYRYSEMYLVDSYSGR